MPTKPKNEDQKRREILEIRTKSLREQLVPINEWFEQFRKIECTGPLQLQLIPSREIPSGDFWMVPYPYTVPVYARFIQDHFPGKVFITKEDLMTLTREDYQLMAGEIATRMEPFLEGMISEELLAVIDSCEDYGVIIHGTTGRIRPFCYSELDHIEFVNLPVAAEYNLAVTIGSDKLPMDAVQKLRYFQTMYNDRFEFNSWLMPVFLDKAGDKFNAATDHRVSWNMTETCHMKADDFLSIMTYLHSCMDLRCKVMRVP